ncbi:MULTISPECIES: MMPL family transporter [Bombella]|uniref:MMPL family transporter n=1 Tax=Bombella pollinis TaxID=2967337 RepID=A0ABT3WLK9_9PROT|nr:MULTISPECIES: MMPL family transporter [Bombella]MCX5619050.1 MMPL family transporter [Bombella pollinis]MUG05412.1 MMPL family transporter [Bombella sp. ESL0378]MUG89428.1 MMPL family transporter [Bombella sp. ESL0385]
MLSTLTNRLNAFCGRHVALVLTIFTLLCAGSVWLSLNHLGITTETDKLFADTLPWKQKNHQLEELFPGEKNTLVAIISSATPEEGREAAHDLAAILAQDHEHFDKVSQPDADPFYTRNAFLFIDTKELEPLLDSIIAAQPFLGTLAADPSARGLFGTFGLMATALKTGQPIPASFNTALDGLTHTLEQGMTGQAAPLSWEKLLSGGLSDLGGHYQFVVTHPRPDFSSFEPSEAATKAMRAALNTLPSVKAGRTHALITGEAKLSDEEFSTVAQGMVIGLIISFALVALWLILAVRTLRVAIPILLTLIIGLLLTTGFAALIVGTLNMISVAFAILFVGIAVDFAIQFGVRFRCQKDEQNQPLAPLAALERTGKESGPQIFVASLATAAGFLAFTPTNFVGVAQLGLIAGGGMIIAFFCTLTLLPALLMAFRAKPGASSTGFTSLLPIDRALQRYRTPVLSIFGVLGLIGLCLIPRLSFDADPLHTKKPDTEGMKALNLLEENPLTTPYNAQVLTPDIATAARQAAAFNKLESVHDVLWLGALVPDDQDAKIQLIHDAGDIILPTLDVNHPAPPPSAAELRQAALKAAHSFDGLDGKLTPALAALHNALLRLSTAPDATLLSTNEALTHFLPAELNQLKTLLVPPPSITMQSIPAHIRADYIASNGAYRLVIHPKGQMSETKTLHRFVNELETVTPDISGPALEIIASAQTITHAFITAAICAIIAIALILLITLRRVLDSLLVLLPLLLSSLLTVILVITVPEQLNYANIIALPLLLGVGVSFNIYFVMNWRAGLHNPLSSPTARAVLFSALTTGSAFGSLAASIHPGTASMGRLLLLSLTCTLICSLVFIPALLPGEKEDLK